MQVTLACASVHNNRGYHFHSYFLLILLLRSFLLDLLPQYFFSFQLASEFSISAEMRQGERHQQLWYQKQNFFVPSQILNIYLLIQLLVVFRALTKMRGGIGVVYFPKYMISALKDNLAKIDRDLNVLRGGGGGGGSLV